MNDLSISGVKLFKACPRAYELHYIYKMMPTTETEALSIGANYHDMLEQMHKHSIVPEIENKETAMANAYAKYLFPKMPKFDSEVWFTKTVGRGHTLVGRFDGIVIGEDAIVEHKTTSISSIDEYEFNLQWDEQLLAYMLVTGYRKAYYTICRKPTIRQKANETDLEFAYRCLEWYDEDTDSKIRMLQITRTDEEVKQYKKDLNSVFSIINATERSGRFYRNTCHCNSWGRKCEYAPICLHFDPEQECVGFRKYDPSEYRKERC